MEEILVRETPLLYIAIARWLFCIMYIHMLNRPGKRKKFIIPSVAALIIMSLLQYLTQNTFPVFCRIPAMLAVTAVMYFLIYFCDDLTKESAGVCTAIAFILAEFTVSFEWQIYSWLVIFIKGASGLACEIFLVAVFYGSLFFVGYFMEKRTLTDGKMQQIGFLRMCGFILITLSVFLIANISYIAINSPFSATGQRQIFYVRSLVYLSGLFIMRSQQGILKEMNVLRELEATRSVLVRQSSQYRESEKNMDILNCKYHDLKNQIFVLRSESDDETKKKYLQEMEQGLEKYEPEKTTGNSVLDVLLTEKRNLCEQYNIHMTVAAEGSLLSFINVMDICSVFGNALDNAIEYLEQIPSAEKRVIRVVVTSRQKFLLIRIKNYCEMKIPLNDSQLPTTKADKTYHGYGLKSIRMAAEKYGGSMSIEANGEWFTMCVLIPLPETTA